MRSIIRPIFFLAILLFCFLAIKADKEVLNNKIEESISYTKNIGKNTYSNTLIPAIDIREEIIRKYPFIAEESENIITNKNGSVDSYSEFEYLFNYYYIVGDHKSAIALFNDFTDKEKNNYLDQVIYLADRNYLLPAYIYERQQIYELSKFYYSNYFNLIRTLSNKTNLTWNKSFQRRLTIARIKLKFLEEVKRININNYYESSYLSALIDDFFEFTTKKRFMLPYVKEGLIKSVDARVEEIIYDSNRLEKYLESISPEENYYAFYEYQVFDMYRNRHNPDASIEKYAALISVLPKEHILYGLLKFVIAKEMSYKNQYEEAIKLFGELDSDYNKEYIFIQDDALLFKAFSQYRAGDVEGAINSLNNLVEKYKNGGVDTVLMAKNILMIWMKLDER